ncbi:MAG: hypothetical protein KGL32_01240 [candidate division NC10 bacterium]|nr:hypothetical protein [candidate division NC10 bacterium]
MARQSECWRGLEVISAVTGLPESTILAWHREQNFPVIQGADGEWSLLADALERWARDRREAERRGNKDKGRRENIDCRRTSRVRGGTYAR